MSDDRKDEERKTPSWQLPQERQPDTDAYHIWTPRPLLRSIYWKPVPAPPFEAVSATYEIFLDQRAWLTMHEHVWQSPVDKTPFGYLIGDLCEDPNANRRFVSITSALPARFDFREEVADQISREATLALQLDVERRRGVLAGWYHRHLGGPVRMSENDLGTHHKHFSEPWQCAFVFVGGDDRCEGACFRSSPEAFAGDMPLPFYEMASNESLLARGVKRSYVDWSNYATVDEVRSEPPPRPRIDLPSSAAPAAARPTEPTEESVAEEAVSEEAVSEEAVSEEAVSEEPVSKGPIAEESVAEEAGAVEAPTPQASEPSGPSDPGDAAEQGGSVEAAEPEPHPEPSEPEPAEEPVPDPPGGIDVAPYHTPPEGTEAVPASDPDTGRDPVRPARIELDLDAQPTPSASRKKDVAVPGRTLSGDEALEGAALERDPAPGGEGESARPTARGSRPPKKTAKAASGADRRKLVGAAAGGLVLVAAALGAWFVLSSGRDESGAARAGQIDSGAAEEGAPAAMVTAAQVDSAGRAMLATISRFYGQAVARDNEEATCEDLARAFVAVENDWIGYNTRFKARFEGPLPEDLAARDERLYAGVQDAEREFDQSGCPRP